MSNLKKSMAENIVIDIMLEHYWNETTKFLLPARKTRQGLGYKNFFFKEHLLFLHSFTGCDTTSTIRERGKEK